MVGGMKLGVLGGLTNTHSQEACVGTGVGMSFSAGLGPEPMQKKNLYPVVQTWHIAQNQ